MHLLFIKDFDHISIHRFTTVIIPVLNILFAASSMSTSTTADQYAFKGSGYSLPLNNPSTQVDMFD